MTSIALGRIVTSDGFKGWINFGIHPPRSKATRLLSASADMHKRGVSVDTSHMQTPDVKLLINFYLAMARLKHPDVKKHSERVAVVAFRSATRLKKDGKAAYLAGIFHDIGKILLPHDLFSGRNITDEEYAQVKEHVRLGHDLLKDKMLFTALVCGLHHAVQKGGGYGLTVKDFPENLCPETVKKTLDIATIVSISDFVDAYLHRTTILKDGTASTLCDMLEKRYSNEGLFVDAVLASAREMFGREV